jgi:DNA-binding transcriptional LysR family regulator
MALSPRMPDLAAFEVLLAVAKTGSLGAAGREVGLTQQAVSARMASIEARTGVRLAVRTPRGSQLTPAGVVVAEWADQLLGVAQHVDAGLASLREGSRAQVKVVASLTIAEQLMPRWLVSMRAAATRRGTSAPQVILTASNSDHVISAVRDGAADLGFIESPAVSPRAAQPCRRPRRAGGHRATRAQVGPSLKGGDRIRTQPNTARHTRTGLRDSRLTDSGALSSFDRLNPTSKPGTRTVDCLRGARRCPGRCGASSDEQAGGGRRPGGRTAACCRCPRLGPPA